MQADSAFFSRSVLFSGTVKSRKHTNPFDTLRDHYQQVDTACLECRHDADDPD